jgi:3-oxoacyl-[acyl-carrier-protein] synthase II
MEEIPMRRVVITGIGAVTPIGLGKDEFWNALAEGRNGIDFIKLFDTANYTTKIAGEVKDFDPEKWLDKKETRHTDRVIQFAAAASDMAIADSGIDIDSIDKNMFGVYIGSGEGGLGTTESNFETLTEKGPSRVSPFCVPMMLTNMSAGYVAIRHQAKGPNICITTACAASLHSIGEACNCIARGDADVIISGGAEAAVVPIAVAGFASLKALSARNDDPQHASRPFDAERNGFVIGEGAGLLVLEEYEAAKKRGAHIYAEIKGYGMSCDAHHITAPDPDGDGAYRAMAMAVKKAGWKPEDIDLINAHGTSTQLNDKMETQGIKKLLGEEQAHKVMIQATKSMTGHTLGAAGAVGTIAALMAIDKGIVHPTINYTTPDPECDLNYVPNKAVEAPVKRVLVNSFGFGGHNAVLAIERCSD